ncbi:MAG: tetratricopeptide repeat protein, partial [Muribaculaceae bacterium]|nr:tetratricopeptide repeat protein [Muribaculaceae bacterium]
ADEQAEARQLRASANSELGNIDAAVADWQTLASEPRNLFGAQASISLAQHYFDNKDYGKAENVLNALIDSGTPHSYWLARGFILLSDVLAAQGNNFEAREYLESLKGNYPGSEQEIFDMINQRLSSLKEN